MKKKKTAKQIAAIVCIVLLAALYLITLISAMFEQKHTIASFDIGQTDADRTQNEDEANAAQN